MTGIKDKFTFLHLFTQFSSVNIADDTESPVLGDEAVQATPSLNLKNVLYVLKFLVSLLSISQFTKQYNCSVTFFPSYCVSQNLTTEKRIGSGREIGGMYYLDDSVPYWLSCRSACSYSTLALVLGSSLIAEVLVGNFC